MPGRDGTGPLGTGGGRGRFRNNAENQQGGCRRQGGEGRGMGYGRGTGNGMGRGARGDVSLGRGQGMAQGPCKGKRAPENESK